MENDILCTECSDRYVTIVKSAGHRARKTSSLSENQQRSSATLEPPTKRAEQFTEALLSPSSGESEQSTDQHPQIRQTLEAQLAKKVASQKIGYVMLGFGSLALVLSVIITSTILAFIGLGLTFWGVLVFFVRPQKYVRSDLMDATAQSSLKSIDEIMVGMGYRERGVYIRSGSGKAVVFIPTQPFSLIPASTTVNGQTFLEGPKGLVITPPGLALSNLIEKKLGFDLMDCGVERLVQTLPKVLVEDLEIVRDVEIEVNGDFIEFKLIDSIFTDFCKKIRDSSRRCGLGCPMCSALACILAIATNKPVLFEEDKETEDGHTTLSDYHLLNESRL